MRLRLYTPWKAISKEKKEAVLADLGCLAFFMREPKIKIKIVNVSDKIDHDTITND